MNFRLSVTAGCLGQGACVTISRGNALFLAGYIPGIIIGLAVMIVAFYFAKKRGYKTATDKLKMSEAMRVTLDALPSLFLIILWATSSCTRP